MTLSFASFTCLTPIDDGVTCCSLLFRHALTRADTYSGYFAHAGLFCGHYICLPVDTENYEVKLVPNLKSGKAAFAGRKRDFIMQGPQRRDTPPPSTTDTTSLHLNLNPSSQPSSTLGQSQLPNQDTFSLLFTVITP